MAFPCVTVSFVTGDSAKRKLAAGGVPALEAILTETHGYNARLPTYGFDVQIAGDDFAGCSILQHDITTSFLPPL